MADSVNCRRRRKRQKTARQTPAEQNTAPTTISVGQRQGGTGVAVDCEEETRRRQPPPPPPPPRSSSSSTSYSSSSIAATTTGATMKQQQQRQQHAALPPSSPSLPSMPASFEQLAQEGRRLLLLRGRYRRLEQKRQCVAKAMELYARALKLKNRTVDAEPRRVQIDVSNILFDIGTVQLEEATETAATATGAGVDDRESAITKSARAFQACLDVRRRCYGSDRVETAQALARLGTAYEMRRDCSSALSCLHEALAVQLNDNDIASNGNNNSNGNGRDSISISYNNGNAQRRQKLLGLVDTWVSIGRIQLLLGRIDDSASCLEAASEAIGAATVHLPPPIVPPPSPPPPNLLRQTRNGDDEAHRSSNIASIPVAPRIQPTPLPLSRSDKAPPSSLDPASAASTAGRGV